MQSILTFFILQTFYQRDIQIRIKMHRFETNGGGHVTNLSHLTMHPSCAGRSPPFTPHHAPILTFFILQTFHPRDIHHNNYIIYNYWEMAHVLRNHSQFHLRILEYFPPRLLECPRLLEYFPPRLLECPRLLEYFPPPPGYWDELTESNSLRTLLLLAVASSEMKPWVVLAWDRTVSLSDIVWDILTKLVIQFTNIFFVTHYPIHAIFSRLFYLAFIFFIYCRFSHERYSKHIMTHLLFVEKWLMYWGTTRALSRDTTHHI